MFLFSCRLDILSSRILGEAVLKALPKPISWFPLMGELSVTGFNRAVPITLRHFVIQHSSAGLQAAPASALGGTSWQEDRELSSNTKSTYTNSQQMIKERESIWKGLLDLFQSQRVWGTRGELDKKGAGCWGGLLGWAAGAQQQHQE